MCMGNQQRRANTATRINDPTHSRIKEHNRDSETLSATIDRALDALEREDALPECVEACIHDAAGEDGNE
ncbi:hypothetical protein HSTV1_51 [Haloarcula sinaiiensis tailed virus 1]|uniref:Uncharacterized protein n=1 Tax=Haloarcula sinaiiensis tailed virus 1 TaxID=1262530 RepID=R9QTN6_9CAUD|nr:hypothetical protein HSTV1_51 [Haloarcula sinaiiensis tailed virus 1]AGC34595.1 hypothetical protein HSTV1_51 [Haloarcula sinaiiensis tailed virus 1]